jgi:hypothetical protein
MKNYLALAALSLLAGCATYDREGYTQNGNFAIVDIAAPGTQQPYDYKLSFRSGAGMIYNTNTPQGRLEFARDELGKSCPDPTIVSEQKVHIRDALFSSIDQYITEIKCHPSV